MHEARAAAGDAAGNSAKDAARNSAKDAAILLASDDIHWLLMLLFVCVKPLSYIALDKRKMH